MQTSLISSQPEHVASKAHAHARERKSEELEGVLNNSYIGKECLSSSQRKFLRYKWWLIRVRGEVSN